MFQLEKNRITPFKRYYTNLIKLVALSCVLLNIGSSCSIQKKATGENKLSKESVENALPATKDFIDAFNNFNDKAEKLFKIVPVPVYSRSPLSGNTIGLAKFNVFQLSKKDSLSSPSIASAVATFSSTKRITLSIGGELLFNENNYIFSTYFNYTKAPEYFSGIGNFPDELNTEEITTNRVKLSGNFKRRVIDKFYAGIQYDLANYFKVETDTGSYLVQNNVLGLEGGNNIGVGSILFYDKRDNRYNPKRGAFAQSSLLFYLKTIGSDYHFFKFDLDVRKYINIWRQHVLALQATTTFVGNGAPFYELALMGGESRMRGYYLGSYRDNVLIDGQIEYRMPVWNRFGIVFWLGAGRVAHSYEKMAINGINPNCGTGLRIKVDSKNNTNLRIDFGFGHKGINGVYLGFSEAF